MKTQREKRNQRRVNRLICIFFILVMVVIYTAQNGESANADNRRGNPPLLSVITPLEIPVGGIFDQASAASAIDEEDGDITGKVAVRGEVDAETAGVYEVTFFVTDSDGNSAFRKGLIVVNDGSFVTGNGYALYAQDFKVNVMKMTGSDSEIIERAEAKAWDGEGASLAATVCNSGGYRRAAGAYGVVVTVAGRADVPLKTVMAEVSANTHRVSFNGNAPGIFVTPPIVSVTEPDLNLAAMPAAPVRRGYSFEGWNTRADGKGTAFDAASAVTENLAVYAQWKAKMLVTIPPLTIRPEDKPPESAIPGDEHSGPSAAPHHPMIPGPVVIPQLSNRREGFTHPSSAALAPVSQNTGGQRAIEEEADPVMPNPEVAVDESGAGVIPKNHTRGVEPVWALMDFILVAASVTIVFLGSIYMVARRRSRRGHIRIGDAVSALIASLSAIAGIVVYLLAQSDFFGKMVVGDKYTILHSALFAAALVGMAITLRAGRSDERPDTEKLYI